MRSLVIGCVLLVASTAGCAVAPPVSESMPAVGDCHQLDRPEHFSVLSDVAPAVECSAPHSTETFQLGDLTGSVRFGQRYPALEERAAIAKASCSADLVRIYLGAGARQALYGMWTVAFLPTPQEWANGMRWVRCDLAAVQSETAAFDPVSIDFSLRGAATTAAADFLTRCYAATEAEGSATADAQTVDVRCTDAHESRDVNMWMPVAQPPAELAIVQLCVPSVTEWSALGGAVEGVSGVLHTEANGSLTLRCVSVENRDAQNGGAANVGG